MSAPGSVLYDAPGPRARRRAWAGSAVVTVLLAGLAVWAGARLEAQGQLSAERWGPVLDPGTEEFAQVWRLLGLGLRGTLVAAALAISCSFIVGTLLAVGRMMLGRWTRTPLVGVMELLRGLPVVISIFFAYRVLPELGVDISPLPGEDGLWYLLIGLTAYNGVVIAEILRAGVASLPGGQRDAAAALGMTRWQVMRLVLLPQAFRVMLPSLISQLVVVLKDTSLAGLLGLYSELLRQGIRIANLLDNPIQLYFVVGTIFVLLNGTLSALAVRLERRLSDPRRPTDRPTAEPAPVVPVRT